MMLLVGLRKKIVLTVILAISFSFGVLAQAKKTKKEKFPSFFGLIAAPVIPNNFIGQKTTSFQDSSQSLTTTFDQKIGFNFGACVRFGITKNISIETGISQVRRNFDVHFSQPDSAINTTKRLSFVNYDIPINAVFYVQLSKQTYMSAALGASITHYPSDVHDAVEEGQSKILISEGRRTKRTYFAANASIGFEYRTPKSGTIYIGGSGKVPVLPILFGVGIVEQSNTSNRFVSYAPVNGSYFSIDVRYFIPATKKKGDQPLPAIVE